MCPTASTEARLVVQTYRSWGPCAISAPLTLRVNLSRLLGRVAKWQTRTVQVRVLETGWGFNSPLAHKWPAQRVERSPTRRPHLVNRWLDGQIWSRPMDRPLAGASAQVGVISCRPRLTNIEASQPSLSRAEQTRPGLRTETRSLTIPIAPIRSPPAAAQPAAG